MKKKLSLLLAVVFIMTLAFGVLPTAGAVTDPAHNHEEELKPGHHWDCTLVPAVYDETNLTCDEDEHTHSIADGCYQVCTSQLKPRHYNHKGHKNDTSCTEYDGKYYTNILICTPHIHSIEAGCYALLTPEHYECVQVPDKGNLTLNVKYSSWGSNYNADGASVSFIDANGDSHTGTTNSSGNVTFTDIPTGSVTFDMIIHQVNYYYGVSTYTGTPESMVIVKGDNSGSVVLQKVDTYNHVDVRLAGTLTIDKKTNGVSDAGYPKDIDVTVSNVSGNYKIGTTEYPLNGFTIKGYELRKLGLTMLWPDSVTINCTLTDDDGNTYPFSYTFEGDEIAAANDECDDHSGFDFDIAAEDIVNTLTHTVTFKTDVGGTIDGGRIGIEHTGIPDGSPFPNEPTTEPDAGYEFDGWYDSTGTKVTSFPETVTADTEWTAKWTQLTYPVTYTYVSGTEGETLPDAISTTSGDYAVSDTTKYPVGTTVNRNNPSSNKYDVVEGGVTKGTWNLTWSADSVAMVSGGITFTGTWTYTPATKYKVTYSVTSTDNPDYGTLPDEASYFVGETVTVATKLTTSDTTKDGLQGTWTFNGWKDGDSTVGTTFTMPAEHVILTGSWTFVEDGKYSVTYTINGDAPASCDPTIPGIASHYAGTTVDYLGELTTTDDTKDGAKGFWKFDGWYTDDVTVEDGRFTMPGNNVEFTGTWTFTEYPSFTINKVDGDGALITSSPAEFTLYNDETHSLYGTYTTNGGTALVDGLAPGIYYLKETKAPTGYNGDSTEWMVIVSENSNQIELFTSNEVETSPFYIEVLDSQEKNVLDGGIMTVENTLIPTPPPYNPPPPVDTFDTAMLTITKTVSGDVDEAPDSSFDFTVTFTPGAPDYWNLSGINAPAGASGSDGTYTFSLKADQSITFRNVPVGTTYVVTETTVLADGWSAGTYTDASGSIGANGAIATIDNVYTAPEQGVAGDVTKEPPSDDGSASEDGQQVAGDVDTLPQTGGISPSTLLGIFGLALITIGGAAFTILRRKNDGKSKSKSK